MRFFSTSFLLASQAASALATGVLLPLYIYPSEVYNDGAANWQPAFDAISASPNVPWLVVINPASGPGPTGQPGDNDENYITGTKKMNAYANVETVGYVRTNWAASPMDELKNNITTWASWSSYSSANISVKGIFFDESSDDYDYLNEAISFARDAFGGAITTVCNFGTTAPAKYYDICDVVIAFESCLNCGSNDSYEDQQTLDSNIPDGLESQAAIIVNDFTGTASDGTTADVSLLQSYASNMNADGVAWAYFCSADYDSMTTTPATVGAVGEAFNAA
jgi:hypothetical protein